MDHGLQGNMSLMANATGYADFSQAATSGGNSTFMVINEFKFLAARSIRTSTLILSIFNTISGFATAAGILFDCYLAAKRSESRGDRRVNIFRCVHGSNTFPFVLSLGITVQGIIFAVSQSRGLDGLFKAGCSIISQFMWPAIFIVPYTQLVFGLEVAIRGFRTGPFPSRGKWDAVICLVIIKILLVATGLVAFFIRAPNFCFASLFWFVAKWAEGAFALLVFIDVALVACIVVIYTKLTRYSTIDNSERVSASRIVYYLIVGVLSNALMVPFFVSLSFSNPMDGGGNSSLTLATVASVVANVSGLLTGGLYLFLRSSTISTITPKDKMHDYERQKLKDNIRRGPDTPDLDGRHSSQSGQSPNDRESQEILVGMGTSHSPRNSPELRSGPMSPNMDGFVFNDYTAPNPQSALDSSAAPKAPEPAQLTRTTSRTLGRRPSTSYSLFPSNQPNLSSNPAPNPAILLPSTAYSPNPNIGAPEPSSLQIPFSARDLKPPPPMGPEGFRSHRRDSSLQSHATVQIGLRFSNVEDIGNLANKESIEMERVHSLGCPNKTSPSASASTSQRPSPLATSEQAGPRTSHIKSASDSARMEMMKSLPPVPPQSLVPPAPTPTEIARASPAPTLSPTVYTPPNTAAPVKAKMVSPKGVGFNTPRRTATTPEQDVPVPAPLRIRGYSNVEKGREDWI